MEKDSKTLVVAVLIILVALVAFNLSSNITGQATKGTSTTISVSPTTVNAGQILTIRAAAGKDGVYKDVYFYKDKGIQGDTEDDIRIGEVSSLCRSYKCYGVLTLSQRIPDDWPDMYGTGSYYIKVKDGSSVGTENTYVYSYFTLKETAPTPLATRGRW